MFLEFQPTRQIRGEPKRRWFHNSTADLIVWLKDDGSIQGFQFCYQHSSTEHALTWKHGYGFSHMRVDSGVGTWVHKGTPLLVPNGKFDAEVILASFGAQANSLPSEYERFVTAKLRALL